MSQKSNVNPDHYRIAGRDRPNENVVHDDHKQEYSQAQKRPEQNASEFIPGAPPAGAEGGMFGKEEEGQKGRDAGGGQVKQSRKPRK